MIQYFVPGSSQTTPQVLSDLGLCVLNEVSQTIATRISRVVSPSGRGVRGGPGGLHGVIVGESIAGYYPDRQTWVPAPQGDEDQPPYWVGWSNDSKPTAAELIRSELLPSKTVTFRDGSAWEVPILYQWHEGAETPAVWSSPLPTMVDIDRYGHATEGPVVSEYRAVFELGMKILIRTASANDGSADEISTSDYLQFACDLLACNYRVSLLELSSSVMDCFSRTDAMNVILAAIDWEGYLAAADAWVNGQSEQTVEASV